MDKLLKPVINILRLLLGALFVFSGFVKCVDPIGGAIKIEDYFMAWGMEVPFSVDIALSLIQNIVEFTIGYMLIFNIFMPIASLFALLFMCFFTPLTLYIVIANPVSDCGCFGEAVKLSNMATFVKNIIFLAVAIVVFICRGRFTNRLSLWRNIAIFSLGILVAFMISVIGISNEPMIDFRPYAVGTDIRAAMQIPEDAPLTEYKTTFILERNGKRQEFDENNYPYNDSTWVFIDTRTEIISEGYVPAITDFTLSDSNGESLTDDILASTEPIYLVVSPQLDLIEQQRIERIAEIQKFMYEQNIQMYIVTASSGAAQSQFENAAQMGFDFLSADETMLKTMMRCNGGLMCIQNGVIVAKYHIDHVPNVSSLSNPLSTYLTDLENSRVKLSIVAIALAMGILILLLYKKHKRNSK